MTAVVADAYRPPLPFLPDRVSETHVGVKGGNHFRLPKRREEVAQNLTANPSKLVGSLPRLRIADCRLGIEFHFDFGLRLADFGLSIRNPQSSILN